MSEMNRNELMEQLEALRTENEALNAALKAKKQGPGVTLKIGEKGGICVYGLACQPVTLYRSQMEKLLDHSDKIREFIKANESKLTVKAQKA
jgi:hypothetical protein